MQKFGKIHGFPTVSIHPVRSAASSPCAGDVRTRHGRLNVSSSNPSGSGSLAAAAFSSITAGENPLPLPLVAGEPSRRHTSVIFRPWEKTICCLSQLHAGNPSRSDA
ncbi:hypothetical protein ACLOJK_021652 [Asimina triloba]